MFSYSSGGGTPGTWSAPRRISSAPDRGYYAAPALSPDGRDVYVVYNAFTTPFRNDTTSPRALVGVVKHADVVGGVPGAFTELHRGTPGEARGSATSTRPPRATTRPLSGTTPASPPTVRRSTRGGCRSKLRQQSMTFPRRRRTSCARRPSGTPTSLAGRVPIRPSPSIVHLTDEEGRRKAPFLFPPPCISGPGGEPNAAALAAPPAPLEDFRWAASWLVPETDEGGMRTGRATPQTAAPAGRQQLVPHMQRASPRAGYVVRATRA
jgi:hypothetical protein